MPNVASAFEPMTIPAYPAADLASRLTQIAGEFSQVAYASSLGAEDMVVTDAIFTAELPISVFTLDTGRLPRETLELLQQIRTRYSRDVEVFRPDVEEVARYVYAHGENAFYDSVDLRKSCCHIRKVEPLKKALTGRDAWVTGLRRAQAVTRADLPLREFDASHGLVKFNPLADWDEEEVWAYIRDRKVPYNALHDRGYPSIGCDPCTRAIRPGEDIRAGRWWWESKDSKECGIHLSPTMKPHEEKIS
jgi:phosphoadenosine phosphosulfate reductase